MPMCQLRMLLYRQSFFIFTLAYRHINLLAYYYNVYETRKMEAFGQLLDILDELRVKCPWDRKQTNESLRTNTIEETYELCDAIMKDDNNNIKKSWATCSCISSSMQK